MRSFSTSDNAKRSLSTSGNVKSSLSTSGNVKRSFSTSDKVMISLSTFGNVKVVKYFINQAKLLDNTKFNDCPGQYKKVFKYLRH